jgi:hypothetical protein
VLKIYKNVFLLPIAKAAAAVDVLLLNIYRKKSKYFNSTIEAFKKSQFSKCVIENGQKSFANGV